MRNTGRSPRSRRRAFSSTIAAADLREHRRIDRGAGRIERRVEREHADRGKKRAHLAAVGWKARLARHLDRHAARAGEIAVVVVVPRRHRIRDRFAGIDQRAIGGVDERARAARDEHRLHRVLESELAPVEARHRLAQLEHAVRRRIVRVPGRERALDSGDQRLREAGTRADRSRRP